MLDVTFYFFKCIFLYEGSLETSLIKTMCKIKTNKVVSCVPFTQWDFPFFSCPCTSPKSALESPPTLWSRFWECMGGTQKRRESSIAQIEVCCTSRMAALDTVLYLEVEIQFSFIEKLIFIGFFLIGWHANSGFQLQHFGKGSHVWSTLRLYPLHCCASYTTFHSN